MINPRLSFIMSGPALGPGISRGLFSLRQITLRHVYACAGFARDVLARRKSEGWQSCAAYVGKSVKDCNCRGRGVSLKVGISDLIRTFKDIYGGLCICESGLFFHTYIRQFILEIIIETFVELTYAEAFLFNPEHHKIHQFRPHHFLYFIQIPFSRAIIDVEAMPSVVLKGGHKIHKKRDQNS